MPERELPVYMRLGDNPAEFRVGSIIFEPGENPGAALPRLLRGV